MEGPPVHAVAMPASAPAPITATPQFQQMFASLVQMFEGSNPTSNVDRRLLELEASRDSLTAELSKTKASLTSMQEILASTRTDLATCRGLLREHTTLIHDLNQFAGQLKQDSAQLLNHLNTNWNKVHQVEGGFYQAHQKLMEHVNNIAGQQSAKIDHFQSNIVGPFFSAIQQVIVKDDSSSRCKGPQTPDSTSAAEAKAHVPDSLQTSLKEANAQDPGSSSTSIAVDTNRSTSFDSNAPLADVCTQSSSHASALHEASQHRERIVCMDSPVASNGPPSSVQSRPANASLVPQSPIQTSTTSGTNDQMAAASVIVDAALPADTDAPSESTSGNVRIQPRPSPSPSQSPSMQNASAHSTPQTSRASSLSLCLPPHANSTPVKKAAEAVTAPANMKRKRASSVECVGMKLAKGAADGVRSTPGVKGAAEQNDIAQRRRLKPAQLRSAPSPAAPSRKPRENEGVQSGISSAISPSSPSSYAFGPTHIFGRPSMISPKAARSSTQPPGCTKKPTSRQSAAEQAPVGGTSTRSPSSPVMPSRTTQRGQEEITGPSDTTRAAREAPVQLDNIPNDSTSLSICAEAACANQVGDTPTTEPRVGPATAAAGLRPSRGPLVQSDETAAASQPTRIKTEQTQCGAELDIQASFASPANVNPTARSSTQASSQEVGSQETRGDSPVRRTNGEAAQAAPLITPSRSGSSGSDMALGVDSMRVYHSRPAGASTNQPANETSAPPVSGVASLVSKQTELRVKGRASHEQARSDALARQSNSSYPPPRPESRASAGASRQSEPRLRNNQDSPQRRTAAADEEGQQSLIQCLDNRRGKPAEYERDFPFYIWAWLGDAGVWSGNSCDTAPVVIDPDPVLPESLISESLAQNLVRQGRARKIALQGATGLELDITWRFDTRRDFRQPGTSSRFRAAQCRFVIVPTTYMKGGIYLGKEELDRLGLKIVPQMRSEISRAYLGVDGRIESGRCLCAFPANQRNLSLHRPFERICKLAEFAISRTDDPRFSLLRCADDERSAVSSMDRQQDDGWRQVRRPTTPPLADRFRGTIAGLAGSPPGSRPLESRIEPSSFSDGTNRGMSSHFAAREAGFTRIASLEKAIGADSATSSTVSCTLLQQRIGVNTDPIPDDPTSTTNASGVVCPLDSGSPLSELDDSQDDDVKSQGVDELSDD